MTFFASRLSPLLALVTRVLLSGIKYQSGNAGRLLSLFPLVSTCMRPMQNARTLAHKGMSYRYTVDLYRERGEGVRYVAAFGIRDNDKIINWCPLSLSPGGASPQRDISRLETGLERRGALQGARVYNVAWILVLEKRGCRGEFSREKFQAIKGSASSFGKIVDWTKGFRRIN